MSPLPFSQERQMRTRLIGSGQMNNGETEYAVCHKLSENGLGSYTKENMQITKLCRVDLPSRVDKSLVIKSRHSAQLIYSRKIRQRTHTNNESSWRAQRIGFVYHHTNEFKSPGAQCRMVAKKVKRLPIDMRRALYAFPLAHLGRFQKVA